MITDDTDSKLNPLSIREDQVRILKKAWDDEEVRALWGREMILFGKVRDYWQYYIDRGRKLQDYYSGKIFTDAQRAVYEDVEEKICVEPRIMKSPVRAFVGNLIKSRRSGQISSESGDLENPNDSQAEIEVIDAVLKAIERKTEEKYIIRDAIHESSVACYPVVTPFEKAGPDDGPCCGGYKLSAYPWDSCVFGPITFKNTGQINEWFRLEFRSVGQLIENFPEMEKQIRSHFQSKKNLDRELLSSISAWSDDLSSEVRDQLYNIVNAGEVQLTQVNGLVPCIEHLFPIKRTEEVWINIFDNSGLDYKVKPKTWSDARWDAWLQENGSVYRGPYERPIRTLWSTVFTTTGLVLENERHWYQECGKLPGTIWVPAVLFGVPTGPTEDMADDTLANAVAETEYLHDIRTGSGKLLAVIEGTVKNLDSLATEASKSLGVVVLDKKVQNPQSAIMEMVRNPNKMYKEYAEQRKAAMIESTRINESMQGQVAPRQAAIAKNLEIAQAFIVLAIYIDNFNQQWERHQNLKLSMIPYCCTEHDVYQIMDETTNQPMQVEVNSPAETTIDENGEVVVTRVVNDITSRQYRWSIKPVDDSPTAKEQAMQEALVFINAASGPLIAADKSGKFFARVLAAMPNIFLNQAGKALLQDAEANSKAQSEADQQQTLREAQIALTKAQADMERARKAGTSVSISGEDLVQFPQLLPIIEQLQSAQPPQPAPPTAQPQTMAAPTPDMGMMQPA